MKHLQIENISSNELYNIVKDAIDAAIKNNKTPNEEKDVKYITRKQTAELLGLSLPTLNEYTKRGILQGYRIGSRVRYKKEEVINSLEEIQSIKHRIK